jgi:hypothetical protein
MRKLRLVLVVFATMAAMVYAGSAVAPATGSTASSEHQRIIDFWTPERVAQAIPRDFVFDATTGRFELKKPDNPGGGKPGGGGGGGSTSGDTTGSSWSTDDNVAKTTGKVLFEMDGSYWVCSASVVRNQSSDQAVVLTAGHCVYDETNGAFATNWMFIPDYDAKPTSLTTDGSFCADTKYGCFTATALAVDSGFATAGGFNATATVNDFAFVVAGNGDESLDQFLSRNSLTAQQITFENATTTSDATLPTLGDGTWLFGYPAAKKYKGTDLIYCKGPLGTDSLNGNATYGVACGMTGGSSGGPWLESLGTDGVGTAMSLNSYGYQGITAMYGPMFNNWTEAVYDAARGGYNGPTTQVGTNTIVTVTP